MKLFDMAIKADKEVYIVSDMYLTKDIIEKLLDKNGIRGYKDVLVSSEYKTSKTQNLFDVLKSKSDGDSYLHFGDDYDADYISAKMRGIDTFPIKSAMDMLEISASANAAELPKNLDERVMLGIFLATVFNSPFALYKSKGKIIVDNSQKLGALFFAPLFSAFMFYIMKRTSGKFDYILWSARDGYLFIKMQDIMVEHFSDKVFPKGIYFMTSRMAAVSSMLRDDDDIIFAAGMPFSGNGKNLLLTRFCLSEDDIKPIKKDEKVLDYVLRHRDLILKKSAELRENYLKYINALGIEHEDKIAFFDLVSSGTCQYSIERILEKKSKGFYFIFYSLDMSDRRQKLDVESFIESGFVYSLKSYLSGNYDLVEHIVSSPLPTLKYFDDNGDSVYGKDSRTADELEYIEGIQRGVLEFFGELLKITDSIDVDVSGDFVDRLYSFMSEKYSVVEDCPFMNTVFNDDFSNRQFDMKDIFY